MPTIKSTTQNPLRAINDNNNNNIINTTREGYGESVVPFSLRFIAALIPFYVGVIMESEKRLDHLLAVCERHLRKESNTQQATTTTTKPILSSLPNSQSNNYNNNNYFNTTIYRSITK